MRSCLLPMRRNSKRVPDRNNGIMENERDRKALELDGEKEFYEKLEKSGGNRWSSIAAFGILSSYGICLWEQ